jgi:hypothetical protein
MSTLFGMFPFLLKLYADSGYQGPKFQEGLAAVCGVGGGENPRIDGAGRVLASSERDVAEPAVRMTEPRH